MLVLIHISTPLQSDSYIFLQEVIGKNLSVRHSFTLRTRSTLKKSHLTDINISTGEDIENAFWPHDIISQELLPNQNVSCI